ncbi:peptidylprolyl isomerase [Rickettsiales endosymbiont of Stachyamoeba lipophora]|uniref:peptidylprolyl isomerase n=1 Tax=Rickettsiales endosymbiont of Stachyamoeba lipophora TaxID=2486578 RepID=UPI000F6486A5|nr:peptidylprolyl isomerase [Rickettsiales endosymbiont of Stachyamoeba lipophora]AZL15919.1 hypothetical protein EF513_05110 [Rickettsiales endosymbiont of Stachyamoeba lipophora]
MKLNKKLKLISSAAIISISLYAFSAAQAQVIAKINDQNITVEEVDQFIKKINRGMMIEGKNSIAELPEQVQENLIKGYLASKLIKAEMEKTKFKPSPNVEVQVQALKENLVSNEFLQSKIDAKQSEKKALEIYKERFKEEEEVKASHILAKSEEEANEIYSKVIKNPDQFAEIAKESSNDPSAKTNGGALGYFRKGQMTPEFEKVAFDTKPKTISKPFKTDFGWHIVYVEDKKMSPPPKFENVKAQILNEIQAQQIGEYMQELYKSQKIEITPVAPKNNVNAEPAKK